MLPGDTSDAPFELRWTSTFFGWFDSFADQATRARIIGRLLRLAYGNPGDVRPVGGGVSELRVNFGPGYRVYFIRLQHATILLLAGGDKDSQQRDIRRARELAMEYKDE